MKEKEFDSFGLQLIRDGSRHFMRYDGGGIAVQLMEIPISAKGAAYLREHREDEQGLDAFFMGFPQERSNRARKVRYEELL